MRLLNTNTFQLEYFVGEVPDYAILSHTWGAREVTLEDMKTAKSLYELSIFGTSYSKIKNSAEYARGQGYDYIWIDTICIDKSSSAELSEAINSMFAWYRNADICFAYLSDVDAAVFDVREKFTSSRWFSRGWTLQELIAPRTVVFIDANWYPIGSKSSLREAVERATGIEARVLDGASLDEISAATKMSWAAARQTTRPEDIAYCLLGLFDVNMPLLYGEGKEKAFRRLQESYIETSNDESIFAWQASSEMARAKPYWGLLASTPELFARSANYRKSRLFSDRVGHPTMITNQGLRIELSLSPLRGDDSGTIYVAILHCNPSQDMLGAACAIFLQSLSDNGDQYARIATDSITIVLRGHMSELPRPLLPLTRAPEIPSIMIDEPRPKYLFVKPSPAVSGLVTGFYIKNKEYHSVKHLSGYNISVNTSISFNLLEWPTCWGTEGSRLHVLDFESSADSDHFKNDKLTKPWKAGTLVVDIVRIYQHERQIEKRVTFDIGLEPPAENPFGTPGGFVRPWYAFHAAEDRDTKSMIHINERITLSITFTKGIHWARVFHKISFNVSQGI